MNTDHPSNTQSRSAGIIATAVIGLIIATVAIVLRFWSRKISKAGFYWDDWFALASLVSSLRSTLGQFFLEGVQAQIHLSSFNSVRYDQV